MVVEFFSSLMQILKLVANTYHKFLAQWWALAPPFISIKCAAFEPSKKTEGGTP